MISAKIAKELSDKTYKIITPEKVYEELENLIIENASQGLYECFYVVPPTYVLTKEDAKKIKKYLLSLNYHFVTFESDFVQTISFCW